MRRKTPNVRRTRRFRLVKRVDFQRIEDAPLNKFEKEVQRKMTIVPSAWDLLIEKERELILEKAIEEARLSPSEQKCIDLTMKGLRAIDIARSLGICDETVHTHLARGIKKIRAYILKYETEA